MPYIKQPFHIEKPTPLYIFLMKNLNLTIGEAQRMIDRARVYYNNKPLLAKNALVSGTIEVVIYKPLSKGLKPLFEESDFVLFDKPSGVLVHPAGRKTNYSLTDEVLHLYGPKAHIVHRLDRETSGLILVAKNRATEVELKNSFENRSVKKSYLALVRGKLDKTIEIDAPLLNNQTYENLKQRMVIDSKGKSSQTKIVSIKFFPKQNMTLIEAFPFTGRQHQIRAHLFHVKHPIIGDPLYGVPLHISEAYLDKELDDGERLKWMGANRLLLHSHTLTFNYKNKNFFFRSGIGDIFLDSILSKK